MKKVLLVDDEQIFHFLSSKMFEVSGVSAEIHSAYNGLEAIAILKGGLTPDIIFVDLDMPTMDGFQFVETFRKEVLSASASKVVVLSSSSTEEEKRRVLALGADVYMAKPLSEGDIKNIIAQ